MKRKASFFIFLEGGTMLYDSVDVDNAGESCEFRIDFCTLQAGNVLFSG